MLPGEPVEFGNHVEVLSCVEPRLHHLLRRGKAEFFESGTLELQVSLVELTERGAAPQSECRLEGVGCRGGVRSGECGASITRALEVETVEGVTIDADPVPGTHAFEQ